MFKDFKPNILFKEKIKNETHKIIYTNDIIKVYGDIPLDLEIINEQNYLFYGYKNKFLTHGFHSYPAKFIPELPDYFIRKYSKEGEKILDPFMGSGTTLLQAIYRNRIGIGIDIDPLSKLITKVKLTKINDLDKTYYEILDWINNKDHIDYSLYDPYLDYWFEKYVIDELLVIKEWIIKIEDKNIKDFYWIVFSSIIKEVSKAKQNSMKTHISSKNPNIIKPLETLNLFFNRLKEYIYYMNNFNISGQWFINEGSATNISLKEIDLAITSPPYANAVDYIRSHILELYWLDLVDDKPNKMKKRYIGNEEFISKEYNHLHLIENEADQIISKIYEKDKKRAYICYDYLKQMKLNLSEVYRCLKDGGKYVMVVGNNWIKDINFESHKYLMNLGLEVGFEIDNYYQSEVIRHFERKNKDRIKNDWIIIFNK